MAMRGRRTTAFVAAGLAAVFAAAAWAAADLALFEAGEDIEAAWLRHDFKGRTDYRADSFAGRPAIRSEGRNSASVLVRRVTVDWNKCPEIEWTWAVTKVQPSADIRRKDQDDVAASVAVLFGDPGPDWWPRPVPTLRYAWTSENMEAGAIIGNPYAPDIVKVLVVERGTARAGQWQSQRRNVVEDYTRAFGRPPDKPVSAISIFTDNDQTGEPALAYYGGARAVCRR
ncbi:MAG TPA: DUF3047 domain-containing protein [Rhodospirillales bacterium]